MYLEWIPYLLAERKRYISIDEFNMFTILIVSEVSTAIDSAKQCSVN